MLANVCVHVSEVDELRKQLCCLENRRTKVSEADTLCVQVQEFEDLHAKGAKWPCCVAEWVRPVHGDQNGKST